MYINQQIQKQKQQADNLPEFKFEVVSGDIPGLLNLKRYVLEKNYTSIDDVNIIMENVKKEDKDDLIEKGIEVFEHKFDDGTAIYFKYSSINDTNLLRRNQLITADWKEGHYKEIEDYYKAEKSVFTRQGHVTANYGPESGFTYNLIEESEYGKIEKITSEGYETGYDEYVEIRYRGADFTDDKGNLPLNSDVIPTSFDVDYYLIDNETGGVFKYEFTYENGELQGDFVERGITKQKNYMVGEYIGPGESDRVREVYEKVRAKSEEILKENGITKDDISKKWSEWIDKQRGDPSKHR
jgi:hypothetical protein